MKKCERCGAAPEGEYDLLDYCATCSKDLCAACMAKGCCGKVPAASGASVYYGLPAPDGYLMRTIAPRSEPRISPESETPARPIKGGPGTAEQLEEFRRAFERYSTEEWDYSEFIEAVMPIGMEIADLAERALVASSETKERDAARLDFLAEITNLSALLECGAKLSRDQVRKIEKTAQIMVMRYEIYRRDRDTPQAFRSTVDEAMKETGHG